MDKEKIIFIYITCASKEEAEKIGKLLLEKRLCACVNIFPNVSSMYWWKEKIETSQETIMIVKTRASLYEEIEKEVLKNHSYTCPCIALISEISKVNSCFFEWLFKETTLEK